jgi:hypothetical protein
LPLPVRSHPMQSRPSNIAGMQLICTGVGLSTPAI